MSRRLNEAQPASPLEHNKEWNPKDKVCAVCGKLAFGRAYFAKAY